MNIVIFGATSAIAQATARQMIGAFGGPSVKFTLIARNAEKLDYVKNDLLARQASAVTTQVQDFANIDQLEACTQKAWNEANGFDIAFLAHGTLPDQKEIQTSVKDTLAAFSLNGVSYLAILTELANLMETKGSGVIAAIGSVAGDRGRQSNYIYGSAKGAIELYTQGLRNRLQSCGVHVLTIKPGFVDTPMTQGFEKSGPLWASPEKIGQDIVKAIQKKRNRIYTPWFWFFIMTIIKSIPEFVFKRLKL